jgi:hypothetical protein
MTHPDVAWILGQANDDMIPLGIGDGLRDTVEFLENLEEAHAHRLNFAVGIGQARDAIIEWGIGGDASYSDEYRSRVSDWPKNLDYDPGPLIEALNNVRVQAHPAGWRLAIKMARDRSDQEDVCDPPDPDEYDNPTDLATDQTTYRERYDTAAGIDYAAAQLVERFGVSPDEKWEPNEWEAPR